MVHALTYHFSAAEMEAYQKSVHCQIVTNHSSISYKHTLVTEDGTGT